MSAVVWGNSPFVIKGVFPWTPEIGSSGGTVHDVTATGGGAMGGAIVCEAGYAPVVGGGAVGSGVATSVMAFAHSATGGLVVGAIGVVTAAYPLAGTGTTRLSGDAVTNNPGPTTGPGGMSGMTGLSGMASI